jgi:hypothetical protein
MRGGGVSSTRHYGRAPDTLTVPEVERLLGLVSALAIGVVCWSDGFGRTAHADDTIAATLTAISVSPATVDTTTGPATATVDYSATDDLSGVTSSI